MFHVTHARTEPILPLPLSNERHAHRVRNIPAFGCVARSVQSHIAAANSAVQRLQRRRAGRHVLHAPPLASLHAFVFNSSAIAFNPAAIAFDSAAFAFNIINPAATGTPPPPPPFSSINCAGSTCVALVLFSIPPTGSTSPPTPPLLSPSPPKRSVSTTFPAQIKRCHPPASLHRRRGSSGAA